MAAVDVYLRTRPWPDADLVGLELVWAYPSSHRVLAAELSDFERQNEANGVVGLYWEATFTRVDAEGGFQRVYIDAVDGRPVSIVLDNLGGSPGTPAGSRPKPAIGEATLFVEGKSYEVALLDVKAETNSTKPNAVLMQGAKKVWPVFVEGTSVAGQGFEASFKTGAAIRTPERLKPFGH